MEILKPTLMNDFHCTRGDSSAARLQRVIWLSFRLTCAAMLISLMMASIRGQEPNANPSLSLSNPLASAPVTGLERIAPFSGRATLTVPIVSVGGRGSAGYTMVMPIDNQLVVKQHYSNPSTVQIYWHAWVQQPLDLKLVPYAPGFMTNITFVGPGLTCFYPAPNPGNEYYIDYYTSYALKFVMADGSSVILRDELYDGSLLPPYCNNNPPPNRGRVWKSRDGSGITFVGDPNGNQGSLIFKDGTVYRVNQEGLVTSIRDRNGNTVNLTYEFQTFLYDPVLNLTLGWWRTKTVEDSLGRQITIDYNMQEAGYGTCDKINFPDFGVSQTATIRVCKANLGSALRDPTATPRTFQQLFPGMLQGRPSNNHFEEAVLDPTVISSVWLPNGKRYSFSYNVYADLARVVTPSGGAIEYDWAAGLNGLPVAGEQSWSDTYRRMVERRTYPEGTTLESKTRYSRPESAASQSGTYGTYYRYGSTSGYVDVDQLDPNNSDSIITRERHHYYGHVPEVTSIYPGFKWGKEVRTDVFGAGGSSLLRQTTYEWRQRTPVVWPNWQNYAGSGDSQIESDPRMVETITNVVDGNLVSKQTSINPDDQTVGFDAYNNPTDLWEYDFGVGTPGALRRHLHTDFVTEPNYISLPENGGAHLRGLPYRQYVHAVDTNGTESTIAYLEFGYDEAAYRADPYGQVTGWTDPGATTPRGNVTSLIRWLNFDGNTFFTFPQGSYVTTHAKYDQVGNIVSSYDGKGNQAKIAYSSSYKFAYPTSTESADPDGLGPLSPLTTETEYDLATGLVKAFFDTNGIKTTYAYNDSLRRVKQVTRAENDPSQKNQTTYEYDDDARSVTVTSDLNSVNDNALKSMTLYDGLGRQKEVRAYETSSSYIRKKQDYDALGRPKRVYNPYRTTSEETYGWSEVTYDALGRMSRLETFDLNGVSTGFATSEYWGNRVLATDQSGRKRLSEVNALGQLINVWEITSAPDSVAVAFGQQSLTGHLTHYDYDVLDNLLAVTQSQQPRTFIYDSLARLVTATNPESGPTGYRYDANGNLKQKIDPRLLPDGSHIVVTYDYDEMDRLKTRGYNDGTPNVSYTYDGAGQNSKGQLTSISSSTSTFAYGSFDSRGRPATTAQTTAGVTYTMSYSYDHAGNIRSQTYPSGRLVVTELDDAGRVAGVKNGATGLYYAGASPNDNVNRIQYAPQGVIKTLKFGNGLWEHSNFNSRLQVTQIGLGNQPTSGNVLQLDYGYFSNGNVQTESITTPELALAQTYQYDDLNRLKTAEENGSTPTWKQTFTYDRFGNRNFNTGQTTISAPNSNLVVDPLNNRYDPSVPGQGLIQYDAAGNLKREIGGNTYGYDAERRMTSYNGGDPVTGGSAYVYDGSSRRIQKITPAGTTVFVYNVVGQLVAEYSNNQTPGSGIRYLTADTVGSARVVTDAGGNVIARHDYLPYGDEIPPEVGRLSTPGYGLNDNVRQKFTQYERDTETSLDYAVNRYYSWAQGRFTSSDPLMGSARTNDPQSWNRYIYSRNNPLLLTDPNGLDWWFDSDALGDAMPVWKDRDPGGSWRRWTHYYGLVYYAVDAKKWVALHPNADRGYANESLERVQRAFEIYLGAQDGQGSMSLAQRDFLAGFSSGLSPIGIFFVPIYEADGVDTTSREFTWGVGLGAVASMGIGLTSELGQTIRVGRWMGDDEVKAMIETGLVQESRNGVTSVVVPANSNSFPAALPRTTYVEFDIPRSVLRPGTEGTGKIFGPNSIFAPKYGITQMPPATNIKPIVGKVGHEVPTVTGPR